MVFTEILHSFYHALQKITEILHFLYLILKEKGKKILIGVLSSSDFIYDKNN